MFKKGILLTSVLALAWWTAGAQPVHRSDDSQGFAGAVEVIPNSGRTHTTIVFTSNSQISPTSNQIVFVLPVDNAVLPPAWSGNARILVGDGFLGVVPEDHSAGGKMLFKFTDREVPKALSAMGFQVFEIVGIARYGEKTPLSRDQIVSLATTARNCGRIIQPTVKEFPSIAGAHPNAAGPCCPVMCTSGGEGSSQCTAGGGGCGVTCNSGYYACCNSNTNNCCCCKVQE